MGKFQVGDVVVRLVAPGCSDSFHKLHRPPYVVTKVGTGGGWLQINHCCIPGDATPWAEGNFAHSTKAQLVGAEYTGGSVDYYKVEVSNPTTDSNSPYMAECNDIIEALGMNYAEGNAFKALWRRAAHRTLGKKKQGASDDGLYDAEKVQFFGERLVEQSKAAK